MKIKDWKELAGKKFTGGYDIGYDSICNEIDIRRYSETCVRMYVSKLSTEQIIAQFKSFGIDIEFEKEMTITQRDNYFLQWINSLDNEAIVVKNTLSCLPSIKMKGNFCGIYFGTGDTLNGLELGKQYLVSDLLKCRIEVPT